MSDAQPGRSRRRVLLAVPLAAAGAAGAGFMALLGRMRGGSYDPRGVPNPRIGHALPDFALPPQPPATAGMSAADIRAAGHPVVLNFFASWCVPCLEEAPTLLALQAEGVPLWGIAYKDKVEAVQQFFTRNGDPFARLARDEDGTAAINWGVYGVPETYFIDKHGIVRWRWTGALTDNAGLPQLRRLLERYA